MLNATLYGFGAVSTGGGSDINARLTYLEENEIKLAYYSEISSATGTIVIPTGATLLPSELPSTNGAIVETIVSGKPSEESPTDTLGNIISVVSFDVDGNYVLSGTPSSYPVALIYFLKIESKNYQNLTVNNIIPGSEELLNTTFLDNQFQIKNSVNQTKVVSFNLASISPSNNRVITVPDRNLTLDNVTTSTTTNITGLLKGSAGNVAQAIAGTDYVVPSALASYVPYTGATTNVNLGLFSITATNAYVSSLTSGRIPVASTSGQLVDYSNLTYTDNTQLLINATSGNPTLLQLTNSGGVGTTVNFGMTAQYTTLFRSYASGVAGNFPGTSIAAGNSFAISPTIGTTNWLIMKNNAFYYVGSSGISFRNDANGFRVTDSTDLHNGNIATTDIANFVKNQNGYTALRVINTTSGTTGIAGINVGNSSVGGYFDYYSAGYSTSGMFIASSVVLSSNGTLPIQIGTSGNAALSFWTNNLERGRFTNDGVFLLGRTVYSASTDIANFYKVQNADSILRLINSGVGAAVSTSVYMTADNGVTNARFHAYGSGFTTSGIAIANTTVLRTDQTAGFNMGTTSNAQLSYWTNNTNRGNFAGATGYLYLGGSTTAHSQLQVGGSFAVPYITKTASYTLTATDFIVDCTTNTFSAQLPTAVGIAGRMYCIKNTGTGVITVTTTSSETIDGITTQTLYQYDNIWVASTGSSWIIL